MAIISTGVEGIVAIIRGREKRPTSTAGFENPQIIFVPEAPGGKNR